MEISHLKPNRQFSFKSYLIHSIIENFGLTKRLYLQICRRPSTLITSIIQPLLWLILFGALFKNLPIYHNELNIPKIDYIYFLNPGIVTFTAFTGSLNAGLPLIFDREFGFLNRLLVSPLRSYYSLISSSIIFTSFITLLQSTLILGFNFCIIQQKPYNFKQICIFIFVIILLTTLVSSLSITLAFILPGHIEFIAFVILVNLPSLFSSTALAPLYFMPTWLQIVACINPMTYVIEIIRFIININIEYNHALILKTEWIHIDFKMSLLLLISINTINIIITYYLIKYKCK